jgi:DNA-binding response OmpR family regulator
VKLLVIEDDRRLAGVLRQSLEEEGHSVTVAFNGDDGLSALGNDSFDLLILDVMLPGVDGFTIARRLRVARNHTPILMLTARDAPADVVHGLDHGADDYLTKPFSLDVLLARVRALSRRGPLRQSPRLSAGDLSLDTETRQIQRGRIPVNLTRTEYSILEMLLRAAGRVVTREALIDTVWAGEEIESNTLDAFIRLLRAKLDGPGQPKLIHTVRGVGYYVGTEH